jgi:hypothetical protein
MKLSTPGELDVVSVLSYDELDTLEIHESLLSGSFSEELCPIFEGNLTEPTVEVDSDFFI